MPFESMQNSPWLLQVRDLRKHFPIRKGFLKREVGSIRAFQDPFSSLNPRMTLLDIVGEPLLVNGMGNRREREQRVAELLRVVGLRPEFMRRFPHAFSGGSASASAALGARTGVH